MNTAQSFKDVKNVVAVDEHVASAGAIVWWRLSGQLDFDTLKTAWVAAGLDPKDLPTPCSNAVALTRAGNELRAKRCLIRPLGRDQGFAVVYERVTGDHKELDHRVIAKVTLNAVGRPQVATGPDGTSDEVFDVRQRVHASFDAALAQLDTSDISAWLVKMMPRLDAVGLRDQGGVYFIPYGAVDEAARMVAVLRSVSNHVVNRVPAMRSEDAVAAILDAVTQEAQAAADNLAKDLEENKLGEIGFANRANKCSDMEAKISRYEDLLGMKLDTVRDRLENLRANLTIASLKGRGDELGIKQ